MDRFFLSISVQSSPYPLINTHNKKNTINTPNIFATNHRFPCTLPPILDQLPLRSHDVIDYVLCVRVDPLDHLALFADHGRELPEDGAQLVDSAFDRLDGLPALRYVLVGSRLLHEKQLLVRGAARAAHERAGGGGLEGEEVWWAVALWWLCCSGPCGSVDGCGLVERRFGSLCVVCAAAARGDRGDEILGSGFAGLDILCAGFEDGFEGGGDVCYFALEHEDDVLIMLAFLVGTAGLRGRWVERLVEGLELSELTVYRGEVLLDYVGEFVDFDGRIVEEGLAFGELGEALEFGHGLCYGAAYCCGIAGELRALFYCRC